MLLGGCGDDPAPATGGDGDGLGGDGDQQPPGDGDAGDGDGDGDGIDNTPVGSTLEGQYWMRSDLDVNITQEGVTLPAAITAYSVVEITKDGAQYKFVDWQCEVTSVQTCPSPLICTSASSSTTEGKAFVPTQRTLTVSNSSWSTSDCAAAVGWKWDCAKDGPTAVPTTETDPLVYNPGGGGVGVDLKADLVTVIGSGTCTAQVVQKVDVRYSGQLTGGVLQTSGVTTDNGSQQNVIGGDCGDVPNPVAQGPGTLRFAKRNIPGGSDPASWTCPSLAEFQSALSQP